MEVERHVIDRGKAESVRDALTCRSVTALPPLSGGRAKRAPIPRAEQDDQG